jgi:hypothetical protein
MSVKDQDVRLRLTTETHTVVSELASIDRLTIQDYVERLLVEHCKKRLEIARALVAAVDAASSTPPVRRTRSLYFIQKGVDGPIKIGVASAVGSRIKTLQVGNAEPLKLLLTVDQSDDFNERALHRKFRHLRLEGEWFRPAPDLVEFIRSVGGKQ